MAFLFIDVLVIISRYKEAFAERKLAHPVVFWICSIVGMLASIWGAVVTFTNPWAERGDGSTDHGQICRYGPVEEFFTMLTRVIRDIVDGVRILVDEVRFLIRPPQPQPLPVPVRVRPAYPYSRYWRY